MPNTLATAQQIIEMMRAPNPPSITFLDASWYLPTANQNAKKDFCIQHIAGAHFFDIDLFSDPNDLLPHTIPTADYFSKHVTQMNITKQDFIVCYQNGSLFSAARAWFLFQFFGHSNVVILDGGLQSWIKAGGKTEEGIPQNKAISSSKAYEATPHDDMICSMEELRQIYTQSPQSLVIYDARPKARFDGSAPEPRKGLLSGHMPGAHNVPVDKLSHTDLHLLKPSEYLQFFIHHHRQALTTEAICTCGSGITACVLFFALTMAGAPNVRLYDGSWSEWASDPKNPIIQEQCNAIT